VVVAPAAFSTVDKRAAGTADTLALTTLCETYGMGVREQPAVGRAARGRAVTWRKQSRARNCL
jgi:phosphopantothenoylcysteine synthetase/decarboxylase